LWVLALVNYATPAVKDFQFVAICKARSARYAKGIVYAIVVGGKYVGNLLRVEG
jgi:hypothetical protein